MSGREEGIVSRIFVVMLVPLLLFMLSGCYDVVPLARDHFKDVGRYEMADVLADSGGTPRTYTFRRGMCVIQSDTLIGTGMFLSPYGEEKAVVAIPVSTISRIEVKKLNYFVTGTLCAGVIGVTLISLLSTESPALSKSSGPSAPNPH